MATRKKTTTAEEMSAEVIEGQEEVAVQEEAPKRGRKTSTLAPIAAKFERLKAAVEKQGERVQKAYSKYDSEREKYADLEVELSDARSALEKALGDQF